MDLLHVAVAHFSHFSKEHGSWG